MDLVEILSFLFQLSFSTLGRVSVLQSNMTREFLLPLLFFVVVDQHVVACGPQDYSVEGMSESLLTFLQHLREFGLVFQRKVSSLEREGGSNNSTSPSHDAHRAAGSLKAKPSRH